MTDHNPMTLTEAKNWLRARVDKGARCPCCRQFAKVYRRPLNSGMARSLIAMYRAGGTNFIHIPTTISARSREEGKLRYWGLAEEEKERRPDGGRAGHWRVTEAGRDFVLRLTTVTKYVHIYDDVLLRMSGPQVDIRNALGTKFDYEELMKT